MTQLIINMIKIVGYRRMVLIVMALLEILVKRSDNQLDDDLLAKVKDALLNDDPNENKV